jgi:predicted permease
MLQDLRLAIRTCRATPVVTAVTILSLALGIGANTALFSLVDAIVLQSLPVRHPEQLAILTGGGSPNNGYSYATWTAIRNRIGGVEGICAWASARFNIALAGEVHFVDGLYVSGEFFRTLDAGVALGRSLTTADDQRGSPNAVAVISDRFWGSHFNHAPNVIGQEILVERVPVTIVGVTAPAFLGPEVGRAFDVAVPVAVDELIRGRQGRLNNPTYWWLAVMVRLPAESSIDRGTTAFRRIQAEVRDESVPPQLSGRARAAFLQSPWVLAPAGRGTSRLRTEYQKPLLVLFALVVLLLLLVCANVASILFARATARGSELSLRAALGASRWRLVRQLLVESACLAFFGAAVGTAAAPSATRVLLQQIATETVPALDVAIRTNVLLFAILMTGASAVLFGVVPAFRASQVAPIDVLKHHGSGATRLGGWTGMVVIAQVTISVILVVDNQSLRAKLHAPHNETARIRRRSHACLACRSHASRATS